MSDTLHHWIEQQDQVDENHLNILLSKYPFCQNLHALKTLLKEEDKKELVNGCLYSRRSSWLNYLLDDTSTSSTLSQDVIEAGPMSDEEKPVSVLDDNLFFFHEFDNLISNHEDSDISLDPIEIIYSGEISIGEEKAKNKKIKPEFIEIKEKGPEKLQASTLDSLAELVQPPLSPSNTKKQDQESVEPSVKYKPISNPSISQLGHTKLNHSDNIGSYATWLNTLSKVSPPQSVAQKLEQTEIKNIESIIKSKSVDIELPAQHHDIDQKSNVHVASPLEEIPNSTENDSLSINKKKKRSKKKKNSKKKKSRRKKQDNLKSKKRKKSKKSKLKGKIKRSNSDLKSFKKKRKKSKKKDKKKAKAKKSQRPKKGKKSIGKSKGSKIDHRFISEAMSDLLWRQGYRKKAIKMLKILSLKNPGKKAYFAARIKKLKKK